MQKFNRWLFPALALCFALVLGAYFLFFCSVSGVVLSTQRAAPVETVPVRAPPAAPESSPPAEGRLELNRATLEELMKLPGIGQVRAQHILDYRAANGPFRQASDLMKVSGIGEGIFASLRDLVYVEEQDEDPGY